MNRKRLLEEATIALFTYQSVYEAGNFDYWDLQSDYMNFGLCFWADFNKATNLERFIKNECCGNFICPPPIMLTNKHTVIFNEKCIKPRVNYLEKLIDRIDRIVDGEV